MTLLLNASNAYLSGTIDLTASPQILLTNSSTYTVASALASVTAEEVSGNGYARANLTVQSSLITAEGDSRIIYNLVSIAASGGSITFDRAVLVADGDWVGYWDYGATTIADGQVKPFRGITVTRSDSGTIARGSDGIAAWSITTATFVHPANVGETISVPVADTSWMAKGQAIFFSDETNSGNYKITAIGSATSVTVERLDSLTVGGTVMQVGKFVCSGLTGTAGADGADGASGLGLRYAYSATITAPPSSGELRGNHATIASVTSIFVHETDRNSATVSSVLAGISNGSTVMLADENAPNLYAYFTVTAQADNGAYRTLTVTYITGTAGTFSGNVSLMTGGSGGAAFGTIAVSGESNVVASTVADTLTLAEGSGIVLTTNAGTKTVTIATASSGGSFFDYQLRLDLGTTPPAAGELWTNEVTSAATTELYLHETARFSLDVPYPLSLVQPGAAMKLTGVNSGTTAYYSISKIVDSGSYQTYTVVYLSSTGDFTDAENIGVQVIQPDRPYTAISANATLSAIRSLPYFVDASAGNITLTIPLSATATNKIDHLIKRIDDGTAGYSVTLARSGSDLIDGETSQTLSAYEAINLRADGVSNWWVY